MSAGVPVVICNQPLVAALSVTPVSGYGPLTITASTSGSSGAIASSIINFGDGTSSAGPTASHNYSAAGSYVVTATVTDSAGLSSSTSTAVTVKAPEVVVSSPSNGATTSSPVHIVAAGFSGFPMAAMQIYLNYSLIYSVQSPSLDTFVTMTSGSHLLVVKGWDNSGRSFMTSLNITVTNPLSAVLNVTPGSILVGGSVTASTAGSVGSITATQINFGDGAIVSAPSATHRYTKAGTYAVTATVTDNSGSTASASSTVVVNPQYVSVTSPTAGKVTSPVQVIGTAHSGYTVTATQVYLDGILKYQTSASSVNTWLSISRGSHQIVVQSWDSSGATFKAIINVWR